MKPSELKTSISFESYDGKTAENYRNDLNEDCVKISGLHLISFLRNKPSKSVTVGSGRSIVSKEFS